MLPSRVWLVAAFGLASPLAFGQEVKFEPGMTVVAKSPGLLVMDDGAVIPRESPLDVFRVERVIEGRVILHIGPRECEARAV